MSDLTGRADRTRADLLVLVLVALALGAVLGAAWWALAPRVVLDVYGDQTYPAEFQPGGYVADDGIASLMCLLGGVLTLGTAVLLARRRGSGALTLGTLGRAMLAGILAALVLWWVGSRLGAVDLQAEIAAAGDGGQVLAPLTLRMPAVLLLWPLASAVVFSFAALIAWWARPSQSVASA